MPASIGSHHQDAHVALSLLERARHAWPRDDCIAAVHRHIGHIAASMPSRCGSAEPEPHAHLLAAARSSRMRRTGGRGEASPASMPHRRRGQTLADRQRALAGHGIEEQAPRATRVRARRPSQSVAICIAPVKAASSTISGITSQHAARRAAAPVDTSTSRHARAGVATAGLTPRLTRRRLPISPLYCAKRRRTLRHLRRGVVARRRRPTRRDRRAGRDDAEALGEVGWNDRHHDTRRSSRTAVSGLSGARPLPDARLLPQPRRPAPGRAARPRSAGAPPRPTVWRSAMRFIMKPRDDRADHDAAAARTASRAGRGWRRAVP